MATKKKAPSSKNPVLTADQYKKGATSVKRKANTKVKVKAASSTNPVVTPNQYRAALKVKRAGLTKKQAMSVIRTLPSKEVCSFAGAALKEQHSQMAGTQLAYCSMDKRKAKAKATRERNKKKAA